MDKLSTKDMGLSQADLQADLEMTKLADEDQTDQAAETVVEDQGVPESVDFRAHHLFSLSQLMLMQVHRSRFAEQMYRSAKNVQFRVMGRGEDREFADHMIDSILAMLQNQSGNIRIVNTHDVICEKCPQREESSCRVFGRSYSADFLGCVDDALIRNTDGVLELGKSYPPEYIKENIGVIRRAIRRTLLELPSLRNQI